MDISNLKVAAFQMFVSADMDGNMRKIRAAIDEATANNADVLALPECAISGYPPLHHKSKSIDMASITEANREVVTLAKERGLWIIAGTITGKPGELFNTALVISPEGLLGEYHKMHFIGDDSFFFHPGNSVPVFDFGGARFGALVCYDIRFPEPFRYLKSQDARVVFVIFNACEGATWKVPVLEGTCRSRAAENNFFIVAVNAAGPEQMVVSRICDPDGISLAAGETDAEGMIYATLDLTSVGPGFYGDRRTDVFEVVYKAMFDGLIV